MQATTASPATPHLASRWPFGRQFTLLWIGQAISSLGDMLFTTSLALWIVTTLAHGQTWAPLALSGVLLAAALPDVLVGPLAGVFVDRWDRRRIMMGMDVTRAALIALLAVPTGVAVLPGIGRPSVGLALGSIYAVAFLASVCGQFFGPARVAVIGDLVPEADRAKATGLSQASGSLAAIIGPPLATALYFALGAGPALTLDALSFVASWLAIRAVRLPTHAETGDGRRFGFRAEFIEGLRFFMGNRILTTVLVAVVLAMLGGGALNALDIFFLTQNLHAPVHLFGVLGAAAGVGVLVGAIGAGLIAARLRFERTFWLSAVVLGLLILVYSRLTSFAPAIVLLFVIGLPEAALNVVVGPLVLQATPRAMVGRVVAVLQPLISLAAILSMVVAGWLASGVLSGFHAHWLGMRWGSVDSIFTGTGVLIVAGGLYAAIRLRRPATPPAVEQAAPTV